MKLCIFEIQNLGMIRILIGNEMSSYIIFGNGS